MKKLVMIKYGELTLKKGNRNLFINVLADNIKKALKNTDAKITKDRVRMFIESDNIDEIISRLEKIFGIHGIVVAYKVNTNSGDIENAILDLISTHDFKTFKVDTKRAFKEFPIKSMEYNNVIGSLILKNKRGCFK